MESKFIKDAFITFTDKLVMAVKRDSITNIWTEFRELVSNQAISGVHLYIEAQKIDFPAHEVLARTPQFSPPHNESNIYHISS